MKELTLSPRWGLGTACAILAVSAVALTGCSTPGAEKASPTSSETKQTYSYTSNDDSVEPVDVKDVEDILSKVARPDSPVKFGVILKSLTNEYWQEVERGIKDAAKHYGVTVSVQAASSEQAQSQQLSIAETMARQPFDAYLVSPESNSNLTPAVKLMQEKNVPIVNVEDARIAGTTFLGPESLLEGSKAGEYLASVLPKGAKVAQIEGQAGSSAADLRTKGFKQAVKDSNSLQLVTSVPGNWDANLAYSAATTIMQQHSDLAAFYANNDTMALGVVKAVADAGKTGKVLVVGTDGVPSAVKAVKSGTLAATTTPQPYSQGYWSIQAALALLQGKELPPFVATLAQTVSKANVADLYGEDGLQTFVPAN